MKKVILAVGVTLLAVVSVALADKSMGTCVTSTAVLTQLNIVNAKDGGFDAVVCGTVFLQDGGETALRGTCTPCTAATFGVIPATCKAAWQTQYCP